MPKWIKRLYWKLRYGNGLSVASNASLIVGMYGEPDLSGDLRFGHEDLRICLLTSFPTGYSKITVERYIGDGEWQPVLSAWQTRLGAGINRFHAGDWCDAVARLGHGAWRAYQKQEAAKYQPIE